MFRLLIIALLIYGLLRLWRSTRLFSRSAPKQPTTRGPAGEMIPCAGCRTFVLKAEAIENGGQWYCGTACRAASSAG